MLRIHAAARAIWRVSSGWPRHVDTFNNSRVVLDANGRSVYRLSGQPHIFLA
jgi:exodeoxyribonuclease VII large subunit